MKIIASINPDTVLVELNKKEIARIHGQYYDLDYSKFDSNWMKVGHEIDLNALCSTLDALRSLDKVRVDSAKDQLERALNMVAQCKTNLEALTLFDKLKDE